MHLCCANMHVAGFVNCKMIITLLNEDNLFSTNASLPYGLELQSYCRQVKV